jgi:hypothetical protein
MTTISSHSATKIWQIPPKVFMGIIPFHRSTPTFGMIVRVQVKPIQAKLPLEAGQFRVLEVVGHHIPKELVALVDFKAPAFVDPRDDIGTTRSFDFLEESMQSFREWLYAILPNHRK